MKKTLAAVAVLGAFAGSALAADVTLYGKIDLGLQYKNVNPDVEGVASEDSWGMNSGNSASSRFGLKGSEEISEGLTVGFQLENGLYADSGKLKGASDDRLFDRESRLYVKTSYGEIAMGRMGNLNSGIGTYGIMGAGSAFGTAWGNALGGHEVTFGFGGSRYDNTVTYKSPEFGGVTVYAQYVMGNDGDENTTRVDRYAALGATFDYGAFHGVVVVDQMNEKHTATMKEDPDDAFTVTGGMTYDFGVVKTGLTAQYFKDVNSITSQGMIYDGSVYVDDDGDADGKVEGEWKGYGVALSASAPVFGGTLAGIVGYLDAENDADGAVGIDGDKDFTRVNVGATYMYPLSKRTSVYAGAGYMKDKVYGVKADYTEVVAGIVHNF